MSRTNVRRIAISNTPNAYRLGRSVYLAIVCDFRHKRQCSAVAEALAKT